MVIEGIDKNDLVLLEFTRGQATKEIRWEHDREFEYNEQMYDVVEIIESGNAIYYWCWWDRDETELKKQLSELGKKVLNTDPQNNERHDHVDKFLKSLYSVEKTDIQQILQPLAIILRRIDTDCPHSCFFSPPTPPPRAS